LPMEPGVLEICQAGLKCLQRVGANVENFVPVFDYELLWQAFKVLRQFSAGGGLVAHYNNPAERALLKPEAVWEIEQFLKLSAHDVFEASVVRSQWYECIIKCFERFDFITMPTAQVFPFPVEQHWPQLVNGVSMDTYHRWMQIVSLGTMSGCPIMSVPVGFSGKRSMGMQIMGRPQDDLGVLRMASAYELNWTHN
jgi:amidase